MPPGFRSPRLRSVPNDPSAPRLLQQAHPVDGHAPVGRLAHVVDGKQCDLHGGERFHFHSGTGDGFDAGGAENGGRRFDGTQVQVDASQGERVTERDQIRGPFRAHDARDSRHRKHISLVVLAGDDAGKGIGLHPNASLRHRQASRRSLLPDVHHVHVALGVEVGELARAHARSPVAGRGR